MTLTTVLQGKSNFEALGNDTAKGEWFVSTAQGGTSIDQLDILGKTGALILGCRQGLLIEESGTREIELFLWGTPSQLLCAQQEFGLKLLVDAMLDRPEMYWG